MSCSVALTVCAITFIPLYVWRDPTSGYYRLANAFDRRLWRLAVQNRPGDTIGSLTADFLIHNTSEVLTCAGPAPRIGRAQADAVSVPQGVVAARNGAIVFVGTADDWRRAGALLPGATVIDARGGAVVPGFVDPHTHAIYAGDRRDELRRRLAGASYAEIAAGGGGIVSTVRATRTASDHDLLSATRSRLDDMLRCGTTTCEIKSGYGLTTESELKMLRVLRRLDAEHTMDLCITFMGAHEFPEEYRDRRDAFVDLLISETIPAVARERLADWCDVFCEAGVFTPAQSRAIFEAARQAGLKLRIHADELALSGGAQLAAEMRVRSADHLIFADERAADAMAAAGVVATLLPIAAFYLKLGRFAPARMLIDRGVAVALATDLNPGGGFSPSMPFAIALACFAMNLTFEEALVAATINAAYALDIHDRCGSLEPGKLMDAVIVDGPAIDLTRVGAETIRAVVKRGQVVLRKRMTLIDLPIRDLLTAFSSSDPTPGGGSASALAASVGASLLMMVAGLPKSRTNADEEKTILRGAATALTGLRQQLTEAIDADSAAYDQVVAAYKQPRATPQEQEARKLAIQRALRSATDVPLGVMRLSAAALEQAVPVAANGHKAAASDVGVAVALIAAAAAGARMNVESNLEGVTDATYAEAVRAEIEALAATTARTVDLARGAR